MLRKDDSTAQRRDVGDRLQQVDQQEQVHRVAPPPRSHIHQEL